jgi:hypothetical protein
MTIKRFNWDDWDTIVVNSDGSVEGDVYRTDNTYECSAQIDGISAAPIIVPPSVTPELSGCDLFMPPRIDEVNIISSASIELFIYGNMIH